MRTCLQRLSRGSSPGDSQKRPRKWARRDRKTPDQHQRDRPPDPDLPGLAAVVAAKLYLWPTDATWVIEQLRQGLDKANPQAGRLKAPPNRWVPPDRQWDAGGLDSTHLALSCPDPPLRPGLGCAHPNTVNLMAGGRLIHYVHQWKILGLVAWVLDVVSMGYRIEFITTPHLPPEGGGRITTTTPMTRTTRNPGIVGQGRSEDNRKGGPTLPFVFLPHTQ